MDEVGRRPPPRRRAGMTRGTRPLRAVTVRSACWLFGLRQGT